MSEPAEQKSRLLSLPGELRNRIYRLNALHLQPILITALHSDAEDESINFSPKAPALAFTCRTAHDDIRSIFFEENTFQFTEGALRHNQLQSFRQQAGDSAEKLKTIRVIRVFGVGFFGATFRFTAKATGAGIVVTDHSYEYVHFPQDEEGDSDEESEGLTRVCMCKIREVAAATKGSLLDFLEVYLAIDGAWKGNKTILGLCRKCKKHMFTCADHRKRNPGEEWNLWDTTKHWPYDPDEEY